jgi:hypothetical protein
MGADKNSSPKRELGLYPKFTTKDPHTSLPRSRSHYGPTNPRNKPETILKRVREPGADSPRTLGGRSATHGRMVRSLQQNDPTCTPTRGLFVPHPRMVREQLVSCGRSATSRRTVHQTPTSQKLLANRIETKALKNTRRTRRTLGQLAPRRWSAPTRRTIRRV